MLEDYLKENNLIITSNKLDVIRKINNIDRLIQYKVMTKKEFLDNYYFSYDKKTIKYLVENHNMSVENALECLNVLIYINNDYDNTKLTKLLEIKKELLDNNLLITNSLFKNSLSNTNIIVCDEIDSFLKEILKSYNTKYITKEINPKKIDLYEFDTISDEVSYICYDIKKKLDNNVDINKIRIICTSEYESILKRIFKWSLIPLDYPNKVSLYDLPVGKKIIELLKENKSVYEIIEDLSDIDEDIYNKIINIFNSYVGIGINISMVKYDLKNTYIKDKHINNAVSVIDINEVEADNINYLVGFNKENYPKIYKDEDIISDRVKEKLGLFTSLDKNKIEKNNLLNTIYNNNFIITYKLKDIFNNYNKPLLFSDEDINLIKNPKIEYNFSNIYNKEKLAMEYDNFYKYGVVSDELVLLKENYKDLAYKTYDNKFTGIDQNTYLNNMNKLSLSYTSIDNFFRCGFRYYLSSVLKLNDNIDSDDFYMNIGNIFHYVLSKYRDDDFDFDKRWNEEASKYIFTLDKLIFLENLKKELKYDIEILRKQENYSGMNEYLFERRLNVDIDNKLGKEIRFTGVVDKLIYTEDNDKTYVSIVDYKTGTLHTDISNMIYGIGMQLPIYLYLVKKKLFPNSIIVGFYLQKIINKDMKETINKKIDDLKEEALRLVGYSNCDSDIISKFDSTYKESNLIHGLKTKSDGSFYAYSKVLNSDELDKIEEIVSNKIIEGTNDIISTKFDINPKKIDKDNLGCMYCPFKDICFMRVEDIKELPKKEISDYLGGDTNA